MVLTGINDWNKKNKQEPLGELSPYMIPLIRYATEDWISEYERSKTQYPNTSFGIFIKEQESNVVFHFEWSLTHKAETIYRHAHEVLWRALTKNEQDSFLYGLRYLIQQSD